MTEDTGAEGDMQVHADRKEQQMEEEMFMPFQDRRRLT